MKRLLFIMTAAISMATVLSAATVNYTADNTTIFSNPERGFITMIGEHLTKKNPYGVKGQEGTLDEKISSEKMSIVLVHYYLDNFLTTETLPSEVLNGFDADMQVLRSKGMKAIVRFSYADGTYGEGNAESAHDAELSIVQKHLAQYASHWKANADVIFCFQAGIVGAWGEWYYSDHFGNQTSNITNSRRALLDTLLRAVPGDRCIQLRTPLFKTGYIGSTSPLSQSEAYKGTPKARLGHHNDAFLENYGDMGTYQDTATQKPYIAQETLYVPIGGESCILDDAVAKTNASYERTIAEMSRLHWTFIQSGYSTVVTDMWRLNGTFDELNRRMGYRFQMVSGTYSDQVAQGGKLSVNMKIRNAGFAPLYNERHAYIVLKNGSNTYQLPLVNDPRTWLPNGVISTVNEQLTVPSSVPAGTYQLYLYLPDVYTSIADKPAYAVRFANTDIWDSSTGMNKLNATVTITAGGGGEPQPIDPGDAVTLPATLDKSNVSTYSDDMTWYQTDYFNFGQEDALNTERWAEWKVYLKYPGVYNISDVATGPDEGPGHSWILRLMDGTTMIAECATDSTWDQGAHAYAQTFDLSGVTAGIYNLRISNGFGWAQPKMKSLTLTYNGELPTDDQALETNGDAPKASKILRNGTLYILRGGQVFTITGGHI